MSSPDMVEQPKKNSGRESANSNTSMSEEVTKKVEKVDKVESTQITEDEDSRDTGIRYTAKIQKIYHNLINNFILIQESSTKKNQ